jgi:hypothetical protein
MFLKGRNRINQTLGTGAFGIFQKFSKGGDHGIPHINGILGIITNA